MSLLIKGMSMPTRCLNCPMYDDYNYSCKLYSFRISARYNYDGATRPEWCPLVDLGKHGRLVDVTTAYQDTMLYSNRYRESILKIIDAFSTVVEAEEE